MQKKLSINFNLDIKNSENNKSFIERFNKNFNIKSINEDLKEVNKIETKSNKSYKNYYNEIADKCIDKLESDNVIFQFFYTTIEYLKKNYNNNTLYRNNNYISKKKYNVENNQNYIENCKYDEYKNNSYDIINNKNYNYFFDIYQKNSFYNNYKNKFNEISFDNEELEIINNTKFPSFIPSNLKKNIFEENIPSNKEECKKNGEIDSDSSKTSQNILEKVGNEKNYLTLNKFENKGENNCTKIEKGNYLVEMFGKKGWICILCNNFNYETRSKCNRCGIKKKPKIKIGNPKRTEIKVDKESQKIEEPSNIRDKNENNKKGDWICSYCTNLNYSFRTICNRCRIPKVYSLINTQLTNQNKTMIDNNNNNYNYNSFEVSPSIIVINNMPNIIINNFDNIMGKDI